MLTPEGEIYLAWMLSGFILGVIATALLWAYHNKGNEK